MAWTASTITGSSSWAGITTETGGVSGLANMSSSPAKGRRRMWRKTSPAAVSTSSR
jgi:hypothetical protein